MYRRRRQNNRAIVLLMIFFFFGGFGDLLAGLIFGSVALAVSVLPLIFLGLMIYVVVKTITGSAPTVKKSAEKAEKRNRRKYSNRDLTLIDEKLSDYFEHNISLAIVDKISLVTQSGKYTSLNQLYVTYGSEKILPLADFQKMYPDVYDRIMDLLITFARQKKETVKEEKKEVKVEKKAERKPEISRAQEFINTINVLNDAIPHQEITNGLDQTALLLKQIDLESGKDKSSDKLDKLYDYYLPILVDILNKYRSLNDSPIHGKDFEDCENELMKTILLINQALKTLYNSIHEYEYMDLSADISTLQSILKKDGLIDGDPFKK